MAIRRYRLPWFRRSASSFGTVPCGQVGFSARLLDLRSFYADFANKKQIVLDSRYNREFRALFVDDKNDATASIWFSNIPHNVSLELMEDQLIYMGDSTVDRIQYTSQIGPQYIRMRMDGVPGGINIMMGDVISSGHEAQIRDLRRLVASGRDEPLTWEYHGA